MRYLGILGLICSFAAAQDAGWDSAPPEELAARYTQLRAVALDPNRAAVVENVVLPIGGAEFRFKDGVLHLFQPIGGRVAGAVFVGNGSLALTPPNDFEKRQIRRFLDGRTEVDESFSDVVILSTDGALAKLIAELKWDAASTTTARAADALNGFRDRFREDRQANIWARVAAGLCSDSASLFFADVHGAKNRFLFSVDGQDEEEVNLYHYSGKNIFDVWTSYTLPGRPNAKSRAFIDTIGTKLDVTVEKSGRLGGTAEIEFTALMAGPRILAVRLAPTLRVSSVSLDGVDLKFIQEDKKKDADLWVILPKPLVQGQKYLMNVAYEGDEVVYKAGPGNFFVGERTRWYPKLDVPGQIFNDRALYRMRFYSPKELSLVATGKLVQRKVEGKTEVSDWDTVIPFTVVGFNFGRFKTKSAKEGAIEVASFANLDLNDDLQAIDMLNAIPGIDPARRTASITTGGLNTSGMIDSILVEARNSLRVYSAYFGPLPFNAVSMTQQPMAGYGQSWPTLVFMPYTAFLDGTMKNQLGMNRDRGVRQFFEQVAAHEVSHQWWGHLVTPKLSGDVWLSEGFAEYSGGLVVQFVKGEKNFRNFLDYLKEQITAPLERSTTKAYEAGPISLGPRVESEKTEGAYTPIVYAKGAYVMHMLRMLMYDFGGKGDGAFIAMMKDFASTYAGKDASTDDFQAIVTKHSGRDTSWFFNQWVHGVEFPKISIQYSVTPNEKGAVFQGTVSQAGVSQDFVSVIPVRMLFGKGGGTARIVVQGPSEPFKIQLPAAPTDIEFNPLQAWLCDLEVKKL